MDQTDMAGRVWKFGDSISTDLMMPGFTLRMPRSEQPPYCMHANRPEWSQQVQTGDLMVAGRNLGCGSSRPAPDNLKALGIACVLADSVAGIFYRNAITAGLMVVEAPGISDLLEEGDVALVSPGAGTVTNQRTGQSLQFAPLPDLLLNIVQAGGMYPLLLKEYAQ